MVLLTVCYVRRMRTRRPLLASAARQDVPVLEWDDAVCDGPSPSHPYSNRYDWSNGGTAYNPLVYLSVGMATGQNHEYALLTVTLSSVAGRSGPGSGSSRGLRARDADADAVSGDGESSHHAKASEAFAPSEAYYYSESSVADVGVTDEVEGGEVTQEVLDLFRPPMYQAPPPATPAPSEATHRDENG